VIRVWTTELVMLGLPAVVISARRTTAATNSTLIEFQGFFYVTS
jgi:hypothetical protein